MSIMIRVDGIPAPQGSKKHVGSGRMVETSAKLPAWRKAIHDACRKAIGDDWEPMDGPLVVVLDVYLPMPKRSKFGLFPSGAPDLDKLQRAAGDQLTQAGVIVDDARIVKWVAEKHWAVDKPGAYIIVHPKGSL